jgi:hypothetical protein
MTNAQFKQWKPGIDHVERVWNAALADWRKAKEEKQRTIDAMLGRPQQPREEAAK